MAYKLEPRLELIHETPLYYKANLLMSSSSNKLLYLDAIMRMHWCFDTLAS